MDDDIRLLKVKIMLLEAGVNKDDVDELVEKLVEIVGMQPQPIQVAPWYPCYPTYPTHPDPTIQPDVWYTTTTKKTDGSIH